MPRRMNIFRLVLVSIFSLLFLYLTHSILERAEIPLLGQIAVSAWLLLVATCILAMPLYFWTHPNRGETKLQLRMQVFFSGAQGYFSYLLVLVLLMDILGLVGFEIRGGTALVIALAGPFFFNMLGRIPIYLGPFVKEIEILNPKLPMSFNGFRIGQISDLHIGPGLSFNYVKKTVERMNEQNPDVVFLTGDIVDHLDKWFMEEINWLKNLKATYGVFYVSGNHEYYWKYPPIAARLKSLGIRVLENENERLENADGDQIVVAGVVDYAAEMMKMLDPQGPSAKAPDLTAALEGCAPEDFKILLAHQPKMADAASAAGFDLQFSGHTHGGQFIPWSLMIGLFQKYPKGLYQVGPMQVYVNQGTGYWGPADRLGTLPEITLAILGQEALQD